MTSTRTGSDGASGRRRSSGPIGLAGTVTLGRHSRSLAEMSYTIRTYGDPVLKTQASTVDNVDGKIVRLVDDMFDTLVDSGNGIALAAPQIGVQKQVVVWDIDENPLAIINPEVVESDGEWVYDEGCLSIPGLYVEMLRPKMVLVRGVDLDGEIIEIEADELEARMFQHEIDHLNGVLDVRPPRRRPAQGSDEGVPTDRGRSEPPGGPQPDQATPRTGLSRRS